ncbi:MAG: hypothetical protein WCI54_17545, partial [Bacteroidia bacterium]
MKLLFFIFLLIASSTISSKPFDPIHYTPNIKQIDLDADKCPVQFFVSANGNDSWTGKKADLIGADGPFLTLERARDEVRKLRKTGKIPNGGVTINIRGGVYNLSKSFELTVDDSGTEKAPVVYCAWKNEVPRILGGKKLVANDFERVKNPKILARLDSAAKGKVLQLNAKALGLTHISSFPDMFSDGGGIFELFFNGKSMPL